MTGFTGVVWDARTTEQLASDLGDGAGPAPLAEAGLAWSRVASELASAAAEYGTILAALGIHWESVHTSESFETLSRLAPWFADAAAAAGRNAARAEAQAAAVTVARMTMPNLAEVDLAEEAMRTASTIAAVAPALVGAAAQAERALHDQRLRAARVMQTYEAASDSAATPWGGAAPAPNLVSGQALAAERAAREAASRAAAPAPPQPQPAPIAAATAPVGLPLAGMVMPPPEKTGYAPTILAGGGPAPTTSSAPASQPTPSPHAGPLAPPMSPHGAGSADRFVTRGPSAPEPDIQAAAAEVEAEPLATWADVAMAQSPAVTHTQDLADSRTLDRRYLDETLSLEHGKGF
ncbi:PPE domain-containing protein [Gordonia aquimaris]|uniref:PPE domain-containing protein n=1 Tax=Gordonia aquimaris TaxID=2984863 RepID=A0A9X3D6D7_9ACTN|nr:PPE domain-containing protein [Gordonia aquimaris]MCX2964462.1 PPE domain-containing protein [Gordonia aquimaris]